MSSDETGINVRGGIEITGMRQFRAALKRVEEQAPKEIKTAFNKAAEIVALEAKRRTPVGESGSRKGKGGKRKMHHAGAARASIRVASNTTAAQIRAGGAAAPYFGFLDYGNKVHSGHHVGKFDQVPRPFISTGRILYPAFYAKREAVTQILATQLGELTRKNGLT